MFVAFVILVFLAGFLFLKETPKVKAAAIEITREITSSNNDGEIYRSSYLSYSDARNSTTGTVLDDSSSFMVGQSYSGDYFVFRGFVFFDTSIIPSGVNITSALLAVYRYDDYSDDDFNVTIQNGQPTYPHTPLESGDYYHARYSGNGGQLNTSAMSSGYNNITLTELGWINVNGTTKLCLRSSRDIGNIAPTQDEFISINSNEAGESYAPKLYVTYETEGYKYILHGPYYENGEAYDGVVNVTLYRQTESPYHFNLPNGSVQNTYTVQIEEQGIYFSWNISSTEQNKTRTFALTDSTFEELYIFVPDPDEPFYLYTFTITDFVGVTDGHLETLINVNGTNRIVERQSIMVVNAVPFWMTWAHSYTLRLICDEGTYTWGSFTALSEAEQNLMITQGMFPETYEGMNVTVNARRMNATHIQINYTDNQNETYWVHIAIKYKSGYSWITAYSTNNTGNTQQINWYSAESTKDYKVTVTALRDTTETWSFPCPKPETTTNPWEGLLDILGTFPFPASNLIGLGIVLCVFGVFSYATIDVGCVVAVLTAMFLTYIGWLQISWSLLAFALVISLFVAIRIRKRKEPLTT